MCASPFAFLRAGPPPPKVALLPDGLFFARALPVAAGATAVEAAAQIELGLETISPFPLAQLYYGACWKPGSEHALVYAAYRRRFTADQTAAWEGVELVVPTFVAVAGADVPPATTVVLASPEGLTAIHWEQAGVPSKVVFVPVAEEATDEERIQARDELLRSFSGSKKVIELEGPIAAEPAKNDREVLFRSGDFVSRLPTAAGGNIDVRDKGELTALRTARQRDVLLWRVAVGCAAALALLVVGEFALMGTRAWQGVRVRLYNVQKPRVEKIASMQELTNRIDDLSTKRLLPLEMVTQLVGVQLERKPDEIKFTSVQADTTRGLYTLFVNGTTTNLAQVNAYENALRKLPSVEKVDAPITQATGAIARFSLTVTFKPNALKPTTTAVASAP